MVSTGRTNVNRDMASTITNAHTRRRRPVAEDSARCQYMRVRETDGRVGDAVEQLDLALLITTVTGISTT